MSDNTVLAEVEETGLVSTGETGLETYGNNYVRLPAVSYFGSATKSPRLERLREAGIEVGKFYLQDDSGIVPIKGFFVTPANFNCYALNDQDGKVIAIRPKKQGGWRPDRKNPADKGWDDLLVSIVIAPIGEVGLCAAKVQVFKAVTNLYEKVPGAIEATKSATAWAARGPLHAKAAEASHWFGRFMLVPSVTDEPKKTSKGTFAMGRGTVVPTPEALVPLFNDYVKSEAFAEALSVFEKIKAGLLKKPTQ